MLPACSLQERERGRERVGGGEEEGKIVGERKREEEEEMGGLKASWLCWGVCQ